MKKKTIKIRLSKFKYLLFLPILLLSFCQNNDEDLILNAENKLTKDAKVLSLMKSAVISDLNKTSSKSEGTDEDTQCTHFLYPMSFEVYSGDDPTPQIVEINSDEELISFIDTLNTSLTTYEFYIYFPIILLDTDGLETEINDLIELEGTLQMAVDACNGFQDDGSGNDDGSGSDDSSGSDDGSGNDDGSDSDSDNSLDDHADDNSNDNHDEYEYCHNNNKKVYICHKGITICVSVNAIWGHMTHHEEDFLGRCEE